VGGANGPAKILPKLPFFCPTAAIAKFSMDMDDKDIVTVPEQAKEAKIIKTEVNQQR
jgi:hypothetical protein